MLCRALLTIIAVSYLICVLILSGLQKEDLDVNMLKKLEHHGLNIDDMNNVNLREDCLTAKTTDQDELITNEVPTSTSSTTKITLSKELNRQQDVSNNTEANNTELKAAIKYFMELQNSEYKSKTKNIENVTTKDRAFESYYTPQSDNVKYIFSDLIGFNSPKMNKDIPIPTTDRSFQIFSKNIIKLWNTYSKYVTSSVPTTETTSSNPIKYINDQETDVIKKIIADYISKNEMIHTTTQLSPRKEPDIARISDEIRRFFGNTPSYHEIKPPKSVKIEEVNKNNPVTYVHTNNSTNDFYDNIGKDPKKNYDVRPTLEDKNWNIEITKNKPHFPNADEIRLNDKDGSLAKHKNKQVTKQMPYNTEQAVNGELELYKLPKDDGIFKTINNLYTNMAKDSNQNIKHEKSIPNDIIKEIAESVKVIVLNDLKKEISGITKKATSTPTEKSSTVTTKHDGGKDNQVSHMMEKFMELFQQFKSIEEKTIISGDSQMKVTERKDVKHEFKGPVKVMYSSNKPATGPYSVRSSAEQFAPIFVESNSRKFNKPSNVLNPIYQVREINNFQVKTGLRLAPITIQTNSFEVPPLSIPIAKPILVHQNIIVTTKSPNLRPRLDSHHTNYIHNIDRYNIADDFRSRNDWQKPLINPKKEFQSRTRDDAYALNERDNFMVKKYDRSKINHNERDYKPHFTKSDYDRMKLRNQEIKRFHERLEKNDESRNSEEKEDCCKIRVASRQQLPLANAKKRSRYDDVHFRNFLKTQQKVNDMLEKILAAKTKMDDPRTVETT